MRIIITTLIVVLNFILQTTLFPYLAIQGVFPNTALIIVTSYSLLRGSKEGALVGAGTGFLMDVFFHTYIGFYTRVETCKEFKNRLIMSQIHVDTGLA